MSFEEYDIAISFAKGFRDRFGNDIEEAFKDSGLDILTEDREEEEFFAAFEWVVPTAIAIFFAQKFIGTLLQEAAKDLYPSIKAAFRKLLKKTSGPEREITIKIIASVPNKTSSPIGPSVSVYFKAQNGALVKFTFSPNLETRLHDSAIDSLFDLLKEHSLNYPTDLLSAQIRKSNQERKREIYMRFRENDTRWEVIDLAAEARKSIASRKHPEEDA